MRIELINWWVLSLLVGVATAFCTFIVVLVRYFNAHLAGVTHNKPADAIRWPVNNTFTFLGILLPLVFALLGFLYSKYPTQTYTCVVASLILLMAVVAIAVFLTFSLFGRVQDDNTVRIRWPRDSHI